MFQPKMLCILPKEDAYTSLPVNEQHMFINTIKDMIKSYVDEGILLYTLSEDELAYKLLKEFNPTWISTLTVMDSITLMQYSNIYDEYKTLSKNKYRPFLIANAVNKNKTPVREETETEEMFFSKVFKTIMNRIRSASYYYMEDFPMIIYFDKNRQYVGKYTPKVGDGKVYVYVDLKTGIKDYYFSGISLDENKFKTVIGGLL